MLRLEKTIDDIKYFFKYQYAIRVRSAGGLKPYLIKITVNTLILILFIWIFKVLLIDTKILVNFILAFFPDTTIIKPDESIPQETIPEKTENSDSTFDENFTRDIIISTVVVTVAAAAIAGLYYIIKGIIGGGGS